MSSPAAAASTVRLQAAVYAMAFFSGNITPMIAVAMPLWALELGASPVVIGLIISSRQFLVVTMSIYGGALMDRFGPRHVTVALALTAAVLMGLFPALPYIWAAVLLQMTSGFCETTNWIGAQAIVGRTLKGQAVYTGRLTASARVGGFIGPTLVGLAWQHLGPVGAFPFIAGWMTMGAVAALFLPKTVTAEAPDPAAPARRGAAAVVPRLSDYTSAFRLLVVPAVALVILATVMRQAGTGVQSSFYGVWLKGIGFEAGTIGLLIGISSGAAAVAALSVGWFARNFTDHWLLLAMVVVAIAAIAITPALDTFGLLAAAIAMRGLGQGLNLPLMMSIAARAVGPDLQGRAAALRITFNRFGGALVPLGMGALAEFVGLAGAFYVIGTLGILATAGLAVWVARTPSFARRAD